MLAICIATMAVYKKMATEGCQWPWQEEGSKIQKKLADVICEWPPCDVEAYFCCRRGNVKNDILNLRHVDDCGKCGTAVSSDQVGIWH